MGRALCKAHTIYYLTAMILSSVFAIHYTQGTILDNVNMRILEKGTITEHKPLKAPNKV